MENRRLALLPNLAHVFKRTASAAVLLFLGVSSHAQNHITPVRSVLTAPTPVPGGAYEILKKKAFKIEEDDNLQGWSYIISGGVAVAISVPAYFLTQDIFAQTVYSLGETLGVASVGYGSYLVLVQNDYSRFQKILSQTALSPKQRDDLSMRFLEENAKRAKAVRKIRVITHSLTAGLNLLNGATTSNSQLKTALYFLGGINVLAAIHFTFSESEEERFYKQIASNSWELIIPPAPGPAFALQFNF